MLDTLADDVVKYLKSLQQHTPRLEGEPHDGWLLIDYGAIVVHLFSPDRREYYHLEELWSEGQVLLHLH